MIEGASCEVGSGSLEGRQKVVAVLQRTYLPILSYRLWLEYRG